MNAMFFCAQESCTLQTKIKERTANTASSWNMGRTQKHKALHEKVKSEIPNSCTSAKTSVPRQDVSIISAECRDKPSQSPVPRPKFLTHARVQRPMS